MWLKYFKCLKLFLLQVFVIGTILSVTAQNKHSKNILMDFDYLVSQLYVQQCTFVEIGEGVCSLFIELPLEPKDCRKRSSPRQLFFGNCLCSEFRSWQLCSHQLAQARPEDCEFQEGTDCPTSSARVHRRLCDVTGMSQWNSQCNCSVPLAGKLQEPLCGFRTCYSNPLPASICSPRTVCGTARCDVSLHGAVYGIKCDRKCKDRQSFCEQAGPATSYRRPVTSEWTEWKLLNCDDGSSSIQQHEAECLDTENKPAFDCLGPGMFCCGKEDMDCICEVKQEEGHLKAYRYTIMFASSTVPVPDHNSLQVRSIAGFKGQAKVWNRILNIGSKDDDSESLFSSGRERKPHKKIKLNQASGVQIDINNVMKEDVDNLLNSGVNIERSNISLVRGAYDELNGKNNDSTVTLVMKVEPNNVNVLDMVTQPMRPLNNTVSGSNNATTDQVAHIPEEVIGNGKLNKQYDSNYHYTEPAKKGMEKSVTKPPSGKESNKKQFDESEIINLEEEKLAKSEDSQVNSHKSKTEENLEKENIADKDNSVGGEVEKIVNEQLKNNKLSDSKPKIVDSQVKQHTSNFYDGAKLKEGSESQITANNLQKGNVSNIQSANTTTGNLTNKPIQQQKNLVNGHEKSNVDQEKSKLDLKPQSKEDQNKNNITKAKEPQPQKMSYHEPVKQENTQNKIVATGKSQSGSNILEKNTLDIGSLLPNNSSLGNSGIPSAIEVKSNEITTSRTTTFNVSGIIVKDKVESAQTVDSTTQTTTFNVSGIIVKNKSNINGTKETIKNYSDDLEALSKIKKEEEQKAHTSFYDEPEPVLKDLDKDSIDDNMADVLNNVIGGKNEWTEKKAETAEKKNNNPEEKSNSQQNQENMLSDSDKAEVRKSKSDNAASVSGKMKKRKFHP